MKITLISHETQEVTNVISKHILDTLKDILPIILFGYNLEIHFTPQSVKEIFVLNLVYVHLVKTRVVL